MFVVKETASGKKYFNSDFIYDLESYPNVFTMTIIHASGKHLRQYEISDRRNDTDDLTKCLRYLVKEKKRMVGFNNNTYDYTLIHEIITELVSAKEDKRIPKIEAKNLYRLTTTIIKKMHESDGKWYGVKEKDHYIKQVDLYKIHHFDNKSKATSLKMLEVNMRSENVEDLPFPVGKKLTSDEIDVLLVYNKHDVMQTLKFYYYSFEALQLRNELSEKFGFDCTSFSDSKIGETLFINRLEEERPGVCYTQTSHGRKVNQTKRKEIRLKECLFDYLEFERPEFRAVYEWLKAQTVSETKGVFSDYEEHQIGDIAKYANMKVKKELFKNSLNLDSKGKPKPEFEVNDPSHMVELEKLKSEFLKEHPCGFFEETVKQTAKIHRVKVNACYRVVESINVMIDGGMYVYGTGGIHMSIESEIVRADDEWVILDADVTSMYPSISIANNVYPEHLGLTFCKVYKDLFIERGKYPKGSGPNGAIKLALNSVYGKSNSEFSPLYDPKYTLTITLNGQLSLSMLAEKLLGIGCKIIQCNTDGVTARVKRDKVEEYYQITKEWEKTTGLQLEYAEYSMMALSDVNNYTAEYTDGKLKTKGRYEVAHFEKLGWAKNHSAMVIPAAVLYELTGKGTVEGYIKACKDPHDFMLRVKTPRTSRLVLVDEFGMEEPLQNICRYYPCKSGGKLVKIMPPLKPGGEERRLGIDTDWNVNPCNDISKFKWDIDYDYYISEANKLLTAQGYTKGENSE